MKRLEAAANVLLILTCSLVVGNLGVGWYHRVFPKLSAGPYKSGQKIADTSQLRLAESRRTLLLMTASYCHLCTESMPFYRKVVDAAHNSGTAVLGVTAEDTRRNESYLRSNGVVVDRVIPLGPNHLMSSGTPTLVLLRRDGTVVSAWRGQFPERREGEVLTAIIK